MLWIGPNREIVGSGADLSNETLAEVDDLCLAARDGLWFIGRTDLCVQRSDSYRVIQMT